MIQRDGLFFHEEIMLLALRDEEGTPEWGTMYEYAIGGAILAELLLDQRVRVVTPKKKPLVEPISSTPVGDPLIDECLEKIHDAKRRASLQSWVSKFANTKDLKHRVAERLSQRGILRVDEGKVLLIFARKTYPEVDPVPEQRLIERLRRAIFEDGGDLDPRTVTLVSLAHSSDVLKVVFDKKELKARKDRIEKIMNGELTGKATREAIEAVQAAVMAAVIIPAVITTTVMHH